MVPLMRYRQMPADHKQNDASDTLVTPGNLVTMHETGHNGSKRCKYNIMCRTLLRVLYKAGGEVEARPVPMLY